MNVERAARLSVALKWIGAITMVVDHIALVYGRPWWVYTAIGRVAFPCFALGVGISMTYLSRSPFRYIGYLFMLGLISILPHGYLLDGQPLPLNIGFTLGIGALLALLVSRHRDSIAWQKQVALWCLLIATFPFGFLVGYWPAGYLIPLAVVVLLPRSLVATAAVVTVLGVGSNWASPESLTLLVSFPLVIWFANRGLSWLPRGNRLAWYLFYPVHMAVVRFVFG